MLYAQIVSAVIPPHAVAKWLLMNIDNVLDHMGLEHDRTIEEIIYVAVIVAVALGLGWLLRWILLTLTRSLVKWRNGSVGRELIRQHVLLRCSHIITPLVIMALIPFAFEPDSGVLHVVMVLVSIYFTIVLVRAINSVLKFIWGRYNEKENTKNLPLNGILNICVGIVWIVAIIVIGSIILDKSPVALLTGLGAVATVLMLIFKDSILGFVAGVQLSQNDMLRIGDWIVVPSTIANGIVVDMSLTAVKVQNWDNTIVTLPPYTLVSTSFQNWRGMSDSGYRLIQRAVIIDADSVTDATEPMIASVSALPGMEEFLTRIHDKGQFYDPGVATVNGTASTNLGLFRAYMCRWLLNHPLIGSDQQILVRVMTPDASGIPLQIYCYTTTAWTAYEAVQSEIIEHVAVMAPKFGLRVYNYPSGKDVDLLMPRNAQVFPVAVQNK